MSSSGFHPRVSASQMSSARWSLEEDLSFYQEASITTTGITVHKFADDLQSGLEKIKSSGVQVSSVLAAAFRVALIGADDLAPNPLDILRPSIDVARALGGAPCYFPSGPAPSRMPSDEAYARLVPALSDVVSYTHATGVPLVIEPSSTSTARPRLHQLARRRRRALAGCRSRHLRGAPELLV